jgi:biopolymer transport protein ExbD
MAFKVSQLRRRIQPPEPMIEMNTTPLIDVMLVLLVMLIITVPIQLHSINVATQGAEPTVAPAPSSIHTLYIDSVNQFVLDRKTVSEEDLYQRLAAISRSEPQAVIQIWPSKASRYAVFAHVLAMTRHLGLNKITVLGQEQFTQ